MVDQKNQLKLKEKSKPLLGQELPYNLEAEKALISSVMLDNSSFNSISEKLSSSDFYHHAHQKIVDVFFSLSRENKLIDLVIVHEQLSTKGQLKEIGGVEYLLELQESIPCLGMLDQYIKIVHDKSVLRNLIISCSNVIRECYNNQHKGIATILDRAENEIFKLSNAASSKNFLKLSELLKLTFERLSKISEQKGNITGVPSGYFEFDEITSGMQNSDLIIMAGRPSSGKTALALNMAVNSWRAGQGVGIFSLEMSWEQLVLRMISSESGISHQKIRNANISSEEWIELTNTAAQIDQAEIYIDDTPAISVMELRAKARRLKAKNNIGLLVIDYLQLIVGDQRSENRTQEISGISRSLKALAKELDIPIIALSQLSRSLESRMDKRPLLSDLRESGAIEQDGDVICFIYREAMYNKECDNPDLAELIIGKQRNGPTGTVNLRFNGSISKFENL